MPFLRRHMLTCWRISVRMPAIYPQKVQREEKMIKPTLQNVNVQCSKSMAFINFSCNFLIHIQNFSNSKVGENSLRVTMPMLLWCKDCNNRRPVLCWEVMSQTWWDGHMEDSSRNFWSPEGRRKGVRRWRSAQRLEVGGSPPGWSGSWACGRGQEAIPPSIPAFQHLYAPEPFLTHSPGNWPCTQCTAAQNKGSCWRITSGVRLSTHVPLLL